MCESFHRVNEQSESKGIGEGTGFIEFPVLLLLAVGEIDQAHYQSQQAEGPTHPDGAMRAGFPEIRVGRQ